jgi:hypothetical protein
MGRRALHLPKLVLEHPERQRDRVAVLAAERDREIEEFSAAGPGFIKRPGIGREDCADSPATSQFGCS